MFQCPDSSSKNDLLAYLERISLYCHQLNITSKVKADVQNISGELIVSGVSNEMMICGLYGFPCGMDFSHQKSQNTTQNVSDNF